MNSKKKSKKMCEQCKQIDYFNIQCTSKKKKIKRLKLKTEHFHSTLTNPKYNVA